MRAGSAKQLFLALTKPPLFPIALETSNPSVAVTAFAILSTRLSRCHLASAMAAMGQLLPLRGGWRTGSCAPKAAICHSAGTRLRDRKRP